MPDETNPTTTPETQPQTPPEQTPAQPQETPAQAPQNQAQLDPQTGLPVTTPKADPFADPAVVAKLAELNGQISSLSKDSKAMKELQKQLTAAQAKVTEYETAQLSEAEKKEKEYKDALAAAEAANNAKAQTELENIKLKAFIGSGLKPEFLRFVQGSTEEEVKESISDLQKLIAASIPAPAPAPAQPAAAPVPSVNPAQPTAPVTQPPAPQKHTYTQAEIAAMSPAEYAKHREAILQAAARNEIK